MVRQHQSKYYSSEGLRGLQAQIDELWGVVEELTVPPLIRQEGVGSGVAPGSVQWANDLNDALAHAATAEVADVLKPDAFHVKHLGHGWYQVVDGDDQPIHEGKLRKEPAEEVWKAAMEAA